MKFLNIGSWGFNLGDLLLGGNDKNTIYEKNGKLKDKHGSNMFLQVPALPKPWHHLVFFVLPRRWKPWGSGWSS